MEMERFISLNTNGFKSKVLNVRYVITVEEINSNLTRIEYYASDPEGVLPFIIKREDIADSYGSIYGEIIRKES